MMSDRTLSVKFKHGTTDFIVRISVDAKEVGGKLVLPGKIEIAEDTFRADCETATQITCLLDVASMEALSGSDGCSETLLRAASYHLRKAIVDIHNVCFVRNANGV